MKLRQTIVTDPRVLGILALVCIVAGTWSVDPLVTCLTMGVLTIATASIFTPLALFAVLLILAPLRTLVATELTVKLPLDIGQMLILALSFVWLMHTVTRRMRLPAVNIRYLVPLCLFIATSALSVFVTYSISQTLNELIKWSLILVAALFVYVAAARHSWRMVVLALLASGLASALIGIYTFLGGSGALHLVINGRFFRAFSTFGQPNPFGGFMGLLLPVAIVMTISAFNQLRLRSNLYNSLICAFYLITAVLLMTGLIMSWSRGAWLGCLVSVVVMCFAIPRRLSVSVTWAILLAGLLSVVWFSNILPSSIMDRLQSSTADFFAFDDMRGIDITSENYAVAERLAHWQAALNMATANPMGVGLGNYEVVYPAYRLLNWKFPLGHAHNFYLNILAETGIIGFLAYLLFTFSAIYFTWQGRRHPDPQVRWLSIGLLGGWVYLIIHSLLDNLYVNNVFLHIGVMLGLGIWIYSQTKTVISVE